MRDLQHNEVDDIKKKGKKISNTIFFVFLIIISLAVLSAAWIFTILFSDSLDYKSFTPQPSEPSVTISKPHQVFTMNQLGQRPFLNGKSSFDPDGGDITGTWTLISSPTNPDENTAVAKKSLEYSAPPISAERIGRWVYQLEVTDDEETTNKAIATVMITK